MIQRSKVLGKAMVAAAAVVVLLACAGGDPAASGALRLPDGEQFQIPAFPFERPTTRQATGVDKQWQEAGAAYQAGDYATSEQLFGEIQREDERNPEQHDAALYRGISLLMDGRHKEARQVLEQSAELAADTGLGGSADQFYLGVAAIGDDDPEAADAALQQAVGGAFDKQAQALLNQLRASR